MSCYIDATEYGSGVPNTRPASLSVYVDNNETGYAQLLVTVGGAGGSSSIVIDAEQAAEIVRTLLRIEE